MSPGYRLSHVTPLCKSGLELSQRPGRPLMSEDLFDRHRQRLEDAVAAATSRGYFSAFDESPSPRVYGESAAPDGKAAFEAWLGSDFPLSTPGADGTVATERSPY